MTELEMPKSLARWSAAASSARIGEPRNTPAPIMEEQILRVLMGHELVDGHDVNARLAERFKHRLQFIFISGLHPSHAVFRGVPCPLKYALVEFFDDVIRASRHRKMNDIAQTVVGDGKQRGVDPSSHAVENSVESRQID